MKAFIHTEYGPPEVVKLVGVEKPVPAADQILVKIEAASVNALDWHLLTADIFLVRLMGQGLLRPKNPKLGADIAGRVEAVGSQVTEFKPGDAVFGGPSGLGGFAEYAVAHERGLAHKPAGISFEEAAAVPVAGVTALQGLRDQGHIQAGQKVLIYGASGGVGTFAVQLAKYFGAEVSAVCSTRNVEQSRALGADHVIDYTKEDFTQNGQQYDLILGVNGHRSLSDYQRALAPGGRYVMAGGAMRQIFEAMLFGGWMSRSGDKKMGNVQATIKKDDLLLLKELLEAGKIVSVIDKRFPFSETPEALRYLGSGHARGKVVITMGQGGSA
jgi:NADPH:quinone reductase-like Zn-dependent oxidoreductase